MKKNNDINKVLKASLYIDSPKNTFKKSDFKIKNKINVKNTVLLLTLSILFILAVVFLTRAIVSRISAAPDIEELQALWNSEEYKATYDFASDILYQVPYHNTALTYHGYSAFYLALSSTDSIQVHSYIDEAINSLRLALLHAPNELKPQLEYMLGKTYFHKNRLSAYYFYSDLAIKYLHSAHNNGYNANDIFEYLGLSYASLGMTDESIAYFTEALLVNNSDVLQLAIAEQYYNKGSYNAAKPYLELVKNESENMLYVIQCMNLLGQIYFSEENYNEAQKEFEDILAINDREANAYYGLGLIYEQQGDFVKARSQWRRALEIEANHAGARLKM